MRILGSIYPPVDPPWLPRFPDAGPSSPTQLCATRSYTRFQSVGVVLCHHTPVGSCLLAAARPACSLKPQPADFPTTWPATPQQTPPLPSTHTSRLFFIQNTGIYACFLVMVVIETHFLFIYSYCCVMHSIRGEREAFIILRSTLPCLK